MVCAMGVNRHFLGREEKEKVLRNFTEINRWENCNWIIGFYIKSYWKVRRTWPTLAQVHWSRNPNTLTRACEGRSIWNLTSVDLRKNCTRRSCTKFSEAELARRGELGARPLSAVLYKSQLSTPHFWLDLMLVHRTKEIPLPSFKPS